MTQATTTHVAPINLTAPIGDVNPLRLDDRDFLIWLQQSRRGVGGSQIGALLGIDPFGKTPADVYDTILGQSRPYEEAGDIRRGRALEPLAIAEYERETGRFVKTKTPEGKSLFVRHQTERGALLLGHPDGYVFADEREEPGILEAKCPRQHVFYAQREDGIAASYIAQGHVYMIGSGTRWCSHANFNAEDWALHYVDYDFDETLARQIIEAVDQFWFDHLIPRRRPQVVSTLDERLSIPIIGNEAVTVRDPEDLATIDEFYRLKAEAKRDEEAVKVAQEKVAAIFEREDAEIVKTPDGKKIHYKFQTSKRVDWKRFQEDHPEIDVTPYETESVSRPMRTYGG